MNVVAVFSFYGSNASIVFVEMCIRDRYKGLREAYAELLNVLPEEKLLGHIIINLPSQKNFQENGLSEAYEAADMNMKIMYSHFQKHGYLLSDDEQKEICLLYTS